MQGSQVRRQEVLLISVFLSAVEGIFIVEKGVRLGESLEMIGGSVCKFQEFSVQTCLLFLPLLEPYISVAS